MFTVIEPRSKDLGGIEVRRALPAPERQMVGPFIFFDQMGPAQFAAGRGLDVRPHPHINLATVTYLFDGEILHRDSLGNAVSIQPGAINWMTAGRGIVHSERTPPSLRASGSRLFGLQIWVALPAADEEVAPSFTHYPAAELPHTTIAGSRVRLLVGRAWGLCSPVRTFANTLYADLELAPGAALPLEGDAEELALYVVAGRPQVDRHEAAPGQLLLLPNRQVFTLRNPGTTPVRGVVIGGERLDGPRYIWWNFVSSRRERIEQAKADWAAGRFPPVPGDSEDFIPLPSS
ncbi:MAG: pirin family protein [Steroidobacteraceae bacterium]|nr:pirin family protein [Steroidobacteraceae bacterium]MDW8257976.1 pirin family protein [Gammaproteobacteria bacterium]